MAAARGTHGRGTRAVAAAILMALDVDRSADPQPKPRSLRPHKELMTAWLLLLLDRGANYGYELRRELDAHRLSVDPSVLYRTLRKLERDGWVESRWLQSAHGPRRRFYRLTSRGRRNLDEIAKLVEEIRDLNDMFVQAHKQTASDRGARRSGDS